MTNFTATQIRHRRIRKRIRGTLHRPRLAVHFSEQHIYVQIIDDEAGKTIVSASTTEKIFQDDKNTRANCATAIRVGKLVAERGKIKHIEKIVFDRGGFQYHGKIKALADAAREEGLKF